MPRKLQHFLPAEAEAEQHPKARPRQRAAAISFWRRSRCRGEQVEDKDVADRVDNREEGDDRLGHRVKSVYQSQSLVELEGLN